MLNKASNAIMTKVRTTYGRRIKDIDYKEMTDIKSVPEAAVYLKNNTHYSSALSTVKDSAFHRGNLEFILKNKIFNDFASLCRFERSVGEHFYDYLILRSEYDEILSFLRYLKAGEPQSYLLGMPEFINKHMDFDLMALSKVKTYNQLIKIVNNKKIEKILNSHNPENENEIDFTAIEAAMKVQLFNELTTILEKNFNGSEKKQLLEIYSLKAETTNIKILYRVKKYYNNDKNFSFVACSALLKKKQWEALIDSNDEKSFLIELKKTKYKKFIESDIITLEDMLETVLYRKLKKLMLFSVNPAVVFAAYIELAAFEINDVTNIIEGIRYSLPPSEIEKLLISSVLC